MSDLVFGCNMLAGAGKKGVLKPDKLGRYPMVLGAFNADNSGGIHYLFDGAKRILNDVNSDINRKIKKGQLYGEAGHPKKFGLSAADYAERWATVVDANAAWQIHEYKLSEKPIKNHAGENVVVVTGFLVPWSPFDLRIKQSFESPTMNTGASIRTVANQGIVGGIFMRDVVSLITWDNVLEQGMPGANKFLTPACEDFSNEAIYEEHGGFDGLQYTREFAEAYEHNLLVKQTLAGENIDDRMSALEIIKIAGNWHTCPRLDMPALSW